MPVAASQIVTGARDQNAKAAQCYRFGKSPRTGYTCGRLGVPFVKAAAPWQRPTHVSNFTRGHGVDARQGEARAEGMRRGVRITRGPQVW